MKTAREQQQQRQSAKGKEQRLNSPVNETLLKAIRTITVVGKKQEAKLTDYKIKQEIFWNFGVNAVCWHDSLNK